jgi:hypothetical protein
VPWIPTAGRPRKGSYIQAIEFEHITDSCHRNADLSPGCRPAETANATYVSRCYVNWSSSDYFLSICNQCNSQT